MSREDEFSLVCIAAALFAFVYVFFLMWIHHG